MSAVVVDAAPRARASRAALASLVALVAVGAGLRALGAARAPDGWDGVGFVEAVHDFDLAAFRPHPPGYPLFVAVCRLVAWVGVPALDAVVVVSVAVGALLPLAGWTLARRTVGGTRAGLASAALLALAPGFVVAGAATLPDAAALTLGLAAYASALDRSARGPMRTGLLVAATLGVQPIALLFVLPALLLVGARHRLRGLGAALVATALGVATWAAPTARAVGATRWWTLSRAQLEGHLGQWGETDAAWRGAGKAASTVQATALQLFGVDHVVLTVAVAALTALSAASLVVRVARRGVALPRLGVTLAVALAALAVVVALGTLQPMAAAPRHALPIAVGVAILFAHALDAALPPTSRTSWVVAPIVVALAYASGRAVAVHRGLPAARPEA